MVETAAERLLDQARDFRGIAAHCREQDEEIEAQLLETTELCLRAMALVFVLYCREEER